MQDDAIPRLYLVAPPDLDAATIARALDAGDVACILFTGADRDSKPLIQAAQARDVAALVPDDADLARRLGADGVHLGPGGDVATVRKRMGDDGIVGAACGESRHDAMIAGEAGADYVAFNGREGNPTLAADAGLLNWWQTMMTLPCVAMGRIGLADVEAMARAGADFVALDSAVWDHPANPAEAVAEANRRLDSLGEG